MNYNLQKDTSDEVKGNNLIKKYIQRPKELEDISLLNFVKMINVSGTKYQHARKENIDNIYPFINLFIYLFHYVHGHKMSFLVIQYYKVYKLGLLISNNKSELN